MFKLFFPIFMIDSRLAAPEGRRKELAKYQERLRLKVAADLWRNGVPLEEAMKLAEKAFQDPSPKGKGRGKGKGHVRR